MDPPGPNDDVFGLFFSGDGTGTGVAAPTTNLRSSSSSDRRFIDSSDDEEDDKDLLKSGVASNSMESASKRLDYMLQFLDRKLSLTPPLHSPPSNSNSNSNSLPIDAVPLQNPLPEFIARGGGSGIFRLPVRAAVHPHRPVSLEVRPHPLREAQIGRFLRSIAATSSHLWAAAECGISRWELTDLYAAGEEDDHEDAVPFKESVGAAAALCLAADEAARVVWSGHRDGRIRCWRVDDNGDAFKEALSWQAHRGPVFSLVITSYGDLWSGSEVGTIKIWPWEAIERSLSLTTEERPMAALLVERLYIDPRSQVAVNGYGNTLNSDVKYRLSDNTRAKVWSAGYLSFALWDSCARELLKVFNTDGQLENRVDLSSVQDISVEFISGLKEEKTQNSFRFFQQSHNAIMEEADAVRRVAAKGTFGDDNRRIEALVMTIDGMVWTGCASGLLVQWDGNGNLIQDFHYHSSAVQCLCAFGMRIWVGYLSGTIQVLYLAGNLLGGWVAHSSPVIKMTA